MNSAGPLKPYVRRPDVSGHDAKALHHLASLTTSFSLSILDSSPDCIKLIERDGSVSFMNRNGMAALDIDSFADVEARQWSDLWPKSARPLVERAVADAREGLSSSFEAFCPTLRGHHRWWQVTVSPVRDDNGGVQRILAHARDISERVLNEDRLRARDQQLRAYAEDLRQELAARTEIQKRQLALMGEIDHRVKNSFSTVSALLRLQRRHMPDEAARQAIDDAAERIGMVSRVHGQLQHAPSFDQVDLAAYLSGILADLLPSLTDHGASPLSCDTPTVIRPRDAVAVGMITAELVTNSVRHGGVQDASDIHVSLIRSGDNLVVRVRDRGCGLPPDFDFGQAGGLGSQICAIYATQLNGEITALPHEDGAEFLLTFPAVPATESSER